MAERTEMHRFCVFCGLEPKSKNKEHIIPRWLIERTGDPNRIASFGVDLTKSPLKLRRFAFDALTFPACKKCNEKFGSLEASAKPIVESLFAAGSISNQQFDTLFDWLDKIRIGLWLGYYFLNKNVGGITPSFHIEKRIRKTDRTTVIIHVGDRQQGINFIGPESPCFQHSPTCFALLINQWCLLNIAGISTISRRIGFPYVKPIHFRDDERLVVSVEEGTRRIMRPVHQEIVVANSTTLHQPIYSGDLSDNIKRTFQNEWLRSRCIDSEQGIGTVFIENHEHVQIYSGEPSCDWVPKASWSLAQVYGRIPEFVLSRLEKNLEHAASIATRKGRQQILHFLSLFRSVDKAIIKMSRKIPPH